MIHPSKILKEMGLQALKSYGQNFLTTQSSLEGFEKYFDNEFKVLEIGPGLGGVTEYLIRKKFSVIAVEKDRKMAEYLRQHFPHGLEVCQDDFLNITPEFIKVSQIRQAIGNLPFYITTDLIIRIVRDLPDIHMFIMGIQKEVGQRILKGKGNSLALFMKSQGDIMDHRIIGKNNFFPVPDVDAMWLVWKRNSKISSVEYFEIFLRGLFWGKRKNIYNTLTKNPFFKNTPGTESWIPRMKQYELTWKNVRAEDLSFEEIMNIFTNITEKS